MLPSPALKRFWRKYWRTLNPMGYWRQNNPWAWSVFALGLVITLGFAVVDRHTSVIQEQKLAMEGLSYARASLGEAFYKRLVLLVSLDAFVQSHQGLNLRDPAQEQIFRHNFIEFSNALTQQVPGLISLQLSPDAVVTYVTNLERNQQALGHDLVRDDSRREQVLEAIRSRTLTVSGPLQLVQGGQAIIIRKPIFTRSGAFQPSRYSDRLPLGQAWIKEIPDDFWGFATILVDPEVLYREGGLNHLSDRYRYALRGQDGLGSFGDVFWGDPTVFQRPLTTMPIFLSNAQWVLGVTLPTGRQGDRTVLITVIGTCFSGVLAYSLQSHRAQKRAVVLRNQAIAISNAKTQFLATMSHELRTPLNGVLGMAEILLEGMFGPLNPGQRDALETIVTSGKHLLHLINEILDMANVEAGRLELHPQTIAVETLCRDMVTLINLRAQQKQVYIHLDLPDNLPQLVVDEQRIRQVLMHLLDNAVKFTLEGGVVTLKVDSNLLYQQEFSYDSQLLPPHLKLSVIDTGIGISPKMQHKLFQPFMQIDGDLNRQYEGTGLGLILVKRLVELHGGRVMFTSVLGQGSCFTITLPCLLAQAPSLMDSQSKSETIVPPTNPCLKRTIPRLLLVENNPSNAITITNYLEAKGYVLVFARNGAEAIAQAKIHQPTLILVEFQLPSPEDLEILKQLRQNPETAPLPILVLTTLETRTEEEHCMKAGATACLGKPVKLKALLQKIQEVMASDS